MNAIPEIIAEIRAASAKRAKESSRGLPNLLAICDAYEALENDLSAWRRAAKICGLYRSDTIVDTALQWQDAQAKAACELLSERDRLKAEAASLADRLSGAELERDRLGAEVERLKAEAVHLREWAQRCEQEMQHQARIAMDARQESAPLRDERDAALG